MDLRPYSKAIVGAIMGGLAILLAKYNIIIDDQLNNALEILLGAVIVGAGVYFAPRNRTTEKSVLETDRG